MQQTETYKLSLIEIDDTFSPDPLNQNTLKVEGALSAEAAQRASGDAALGSRLTALEGHRIAVGVYTGTAVGNDSVTCSHVKLGFTPTIVIVQDSNGYTNMGAKGCSLCAVEIEEGGFKARNSAGTGHFNYDKRAYSYCAIL